MEGDEGVEVSHAIVTGGARGIGAAVVARLVAAGHHVSILDGIGSMPDVPYALAGTAELEVLAVTHGSAVSTFVVDVTNGAAVAAAVREATASHGELQVAVAAAGIILGGEPLWEQDAAAFDACVAVNLAGVANLARAAIPSMLASRNPSLGRFVAIASAAGTHSIAKAASYVAAKHGVVGLVKGLALDLGSSGITANAVCPGSTRTAMLEASASLYGIEAGEFAQQQPIGRLIEPEEIAAAVAWLCSPEASAVTGAALAVDGGMTA